MKTSGIRGCQQSIAQKGSVGNEWWPFIPTILRDLNRVGQTDLNWAGQTVEGPDHHSDHARTFYEAMN